MGTYFRQAPKTDGSFLRKMSGGNKKSTLYRVLFIYRVAFRTVKNVQNG